MANASETIQQAAAATDAISAEVERAYEALGGIRNRAINGHGVYSDPSHCRQAIAAARVAISAAWEASSAVTWPTEADYNAAEMVTGDENDGAGL